MAVRLKFPPYGRELLARRDRGGVPRPGDDVLRARVLEAAQGRGADGLAATTTQNDAEVG